MDPDGRSTLYPIAELVRLAPAENAVKAPFPAGWLLLGVLIGAAVAVGALLLAYWLKKRREKDVTQEDVLELMDTAEEQAVIDENQKEMISNIVELEEVTAADVMTHRMDLIAVTENTVLAEAARIAIEEGRSRLPVYQKTLDNITGMLYVKDLLFLVQDPADADKPVRDFMRSVMFVPESCRAGELLLDFKRKHSQIAVVVDEYGGTSGLVTMEDILEEIVGNIQDEFDDEEEELAPCEDGYLCDGALTLDEVFDAFDMERPEPDEDEDEDFETVSGLITHVLGRIPEPNEAVEQDYGGIHFQVLEVDSRRITKVKCTRLPDEQTEDEDD
ncbi:MAG: HlyC/CorC family transporter [Oscillospiraceae bacterium]|nr:HlyC/CorC family transporter [Oscillospiraceae bacterium]